MFAQFSLDILEHCFCRPLPFNWYVYSNIHNIAAKLLICFQFAYSIDVVAYLLCNILFEYFPYCIWSYVATTIAFLRCLMQPATNRKRHSHRMKSKTCETSWSEYNICKYGTNPCSSQISPISFDSIAYFVLFVLPNIPIILSISQQRKRVGWMTRSDER